ncbi:MAG: J domain-containing protein, partial [Acidobacteriota bacterium]
PGIEHRSRMRVVGEGDAGWGGGPPGDLYVFISVRDHEFFRREGLDLSCVLPVTFSQAALGAELQLRSPHGSERIKIPPGTQSGEIIRLKAKGVPSLNGFGRGDLFVRVVVRTPVRPPREAKKLLKQLAASGGDALSKEDQALLEKMQ